MSVSIKSCRWCQSHVSHVEEIEQHCHRFLWRDMEGRDPDVYVILRVNMGDKPAGAISAEALYKTAAMFKEAYPCSRKRDEDK